MKRLVELPSLIAFGNLDGGAILRFYDILKNNKVYDLTGHDAEAEIHEVNIGRKNAHDESNGCRAGPENTNELASELVDQNTSDRS